MKPAERRATRKESSVSSRFLTPRLESSVGHPLGRRDRDTGNLGMFQRGDLASGRPEVALSPSPWSSPEHGLRAGCLEPT